jgi:hypothetical protein
MAREDEHAARRAIEPMHDVDVRADGVADAKERDVIVVVPAAMDEQPRRLVGDDEIFVREQELDAGGGGNG